MSFYETVLVPGYYRSGEGRKEGALRMLRVLRAPGPVPYTWRPPAPKIPRKGIGAEPELVKVSDPDSYGTMAKPILSCDLRFTL